MSDLAQALEAIGNVIWWFELLTLLISFAITGTLAQLAILAWRKC